jgi:hypothetical protein
MSDGSWVAYVVDHESSINLQGRFQENNNSSGIEYGILCDSGLGAQAGTDHDTTGYGAADYDITTNPSYWQGWTMFGSATGDAKTGGDGTGRSGSCTDTADTNPRKTTSSAGGQFQMSVLLDPASLNTNSGTGTNNSGNRNIVVNSTNGFSSAWPFIQAMNFSSSMATTYGSESVDGRMGNDP